MSRPTFTHYEAAVKAGWKPPSFREFRTEKKPELYAVPMLGDPERFVIGSLKEFAEVYNALKRVAS